MSTSRSKILSSQPNYNETELVALLKSKDERAYSYLYDNYSGALYSVIQRIVGVNDFGGDILQDTFVKIWRSIESFDPAKGRLFTWMLNICRNTAIDFTRSSQYQNSKKNKDIDTGANTQQLSTVTKVDHVGLNKVLEKLKDEHRTIIELAYFKGYTQEEIAKALNMPLGTVKTRARNALLQLKNALQ